MRALLLALCLATLSACGPSAYVETGPAYPSDPVYVYAYTGGGCWADDLWYGACPWITPGLGYYWNDHGRFIYGPRYSWPYRPHAPPPSHWRRELTPYPGSPAPGHHPVLPRRDHRHR